MRRTARFAAQTKVPVSKTRVDIEKLVRRYGAKGFMSGYQDKVAHIEFLCADRHVRLSVVVPDNEQEARQKWRALLLVIKAKLESVDAGIATFEEAFATDIVLPDGKTVWEHVREPIELAYSTGKSTPLLGRSP